MFMNRLWAKPSVVFLVAAIVVGCSNGNLVLPGRSPGYHRDTRPPRREEHRARQS